MADPGTLPSAKELGERINAHLKRIESDPTLNPPKDGRPGGVTPFFQAMAYGERKYIYIRHVAYQGTNRITREQAAVYLAWLDAGNVGKHATVLGTSGESVQR
jgi:hypothetical protein